MDVQAAKEIIQGIRENRDKEFSRIQREVPVGHEIVRQMAHVFGSALCPIDVLDLVS